MKQFLSFLLIFTTYFLMAQNIRITGHRGAANYAPENTLAGIQKALELHVDRVEIDVQQSKDGVVILMHDKTVNRTTTGKGKVKNLLYKDLAAFDAGVKFSETFKNEKIPTLEEAIQFINGKAIFVIEIKEGNDYYPGIEQHVVELIHKYKAEYWCIIHSFNDAALEEVHRLDKNIVLHKLFIRNSGKNLSKWAYATEFSIYERFATEKFIQNVHKAGKKVNVWTVNDRAKMQELISKGVDGLITNVPDIARTVSSKTVINK